MKKLETQIMQSAISGNNESDIFTDRQCQTLHAMADAGLIRVERCENLKRNMNIVSWKLGTVATVRDAKASEESEESEETESAE